MAVGGGDSATLRAVCEYTCTVTSQGMSPQEPAATAVTALMGGEVPSREVSPPDCNTVTVTPGRRTEAWKEGREEFTTLQEPASDTERAGDQG